MSNYDCFFINTNDQWSMKWKPAGSSWYWKSNWILSKIVPASPALFAWKFVQQPTNKKKWKWFRICTSNCTDSMIPRYIHICIIFTSPPFKECSNRGPVFHQKSVNTLWLLQVGGQDPITQYTINIGNILSIGQGCSVWDFPLLMPVGKKQQTSFVEDFNLYAEWHDTMVLRSEKHFLDQISTNWSSHK